MTLQHSVRLCLVVCGALALSVGAWAASASGVATVTQSHRMFQPQQIEVPRGGTIRFVNDDGELLHHVYSTSPSFNFDSGEQVPGQAIEERFNVAGTFVVLCGIHPKMRLAVTVR